MTMVATHLSDRTHRWLANKKLTLTPNGELELQALLSVAQVRATANPSFAAGVIPPAGAELTETETNLDRLLARAAELSGGKPIDAEELQQARLSLCPLFPFC
jgi:hypothetical protein